MHTALVKGDISGDEPPLVRVHVQDTLGDLLGIENHKLGWPLREALQRVADEGRGIVVVLHYPESPRQFMTAVHGLITPPVEEIPTRRDGGNVLRSYGTGSQILRDLGVTRIRVLSAPKQMHAISGFGLEIVEYIDRDE